MPNILVVVILLDLLAINQLMSKHHLHRCPNSSYQNSSSPHHLPIQSRASPIPIVADLFTIHGSSNAALFQSSKLDQSHLKSYLLIRFLHLTMPIWCSIAPLVSTTQNIRSPIINIQIRASLLSSSMS
ncbi:hypothetical protein L3Y34_008820 [Caenorhabditis briggsae]|uniref:Uncharacterized protein n=1 Tax=Caenorhabditis briggsae TaxID=6238 RepID=A0AAE9A3F8_CAEBR|nr:hypothetical protein L3Y34_008820 [Caenorhabditis briggsae]